MDGDSPFEFVCKIAGTGAVAEASDIKSSAARHSEFNQTEMSNGLVEKGCSPVRQGNEALKQLPAS